MAVELDTLIGSLKASLNAPGSTFISGTDEEWLALLGFAFWQVRRDGFFTEWRLDADGEQILDVAVLLLQHRPDEHDPLAGDLVRPDSGLDLPAALRARVQQHRHRDLLPEQGHKRRHVGRTAQILVGR